MSRLAPTLFLSACLYLGAAGADPVAHPLQMQWDAGADDCSAHSHPPLETWAYDPQTYVLREDLCSTWEAPFMYLLIGSQRALLIDTGDVADPKTMPLAATVFGLLPKDAAGQRLPLLVVHSHTHLDHRRGDPQFQGVTGVTLVLAQLPSVESYFGFKDWPQGSAQVDLGGRVVDVLPAPGHNQAHVVYYDRNTGILFAGDFIMPARLLVDDYTAYLASAQRLADFLRTRPVTYVLGGHVEEDDKGELYDWQSTYHPHEHSPGLTKAEVLALPSVLAHFNGLYTESGGFVMEDSLRELELAGVVALVLLGALGYGLYRLVRRLRRRA